MNSNNNDFAGQMKALICSSENSKKTADLYKQLRSKKIYIYGAGKAGGMTIKLLQKEKIDAEGFIDRRGGHDVTYLGKPVYPITNAISQQIKKESIIIVAFFCGYDELSTVRKALSDSGWKNSYYYHDIYNCFICGDEGYQEHGNVLNAKENFIKAAALMEDDESFSCFEGFVKSLITGDPDHFVKPSEQPQYFVDDIPFDKGYSRFIDCGAFDGDTAFALKKYKGEAAALALFEPEQDNFQMLQHNLKNNRVAKEQIFFPCAVWNKSEIQRFKAGVSSISGISADGETHVQCVAIDDAIGDFKPTFIKMDIEGAEYEALQGAAETIKRYTPDLAISVYHSIKHMWEIPLLIKSMVPEYKFYLRCHGLHGMETVLYAVI